MTDNTHKKILYVINHMDWFWSHRLPLARAAQDSGWVVHVAGAGAAQDKKLTALGFTGHDIPRGDIGFAPLTVLKLMFALMRLYAELRPDIVHVITLKYAFIAGLAARGFPRLKIVHTVAGLGYLFSGEDKKAQALRWVIAPFLRLALNHKNAQIIVQNPDDMALLLTRGFADERRCHLIRGSGVDTQEFSFIPETPTTCPLVLMPTRLVHDKGISVFIDMARQLKAEGVQAQFQIAGGVSLHNPLAITQTEMERMMADGAVKWLGRVSDMPDIYARAHIIVYPSWYGEGVPKVLLEAAATGRCIVTTDHPGCREVVADGINGYLVPVKNVQKTAEKVKILIENAQIRQKMGIESRRKAENEFKTDIITEKTIKIYDL